MKDEIHHAAKICEVNYKSIQRNLKVVFVDWSSLFRGISDSVKIRACLVRGLCFDKVTIQGLLVRRFTALM